MFYPEITKISRLSVCPCQRTSRRLKNITEGRMEETKEKQQRRQEEQTHTKEETPCPQ